jgi:hypothetical protein
MRVRTLVVVAGLACAVGWLLKMAVMVSQGGPDADSAPEAVAFFVGLLGFVVLAASTGILLRSGGGTGTKVAAAVLGVVAAALTLGVVQLALTALPGDHWWQAELAFVVGALAALAVALAAKRDHHVFRRSDRSGRSSRRH